MLADLNMLEQCSLLEPFFHLLVLHETALTPNAQTCSNVQLVGTVGGKDQSYYTYAFARFVTQVLGGISRNLHEMHRECN